MNVRIGTHDASSLISVAGEVTASFGFLHRFMRRRSNGAVDRTSVEGVTY